jgi:hypothetical protein
MEAVLELLETRGWAPAGETPARLVRIPTSRSPIGGRGGKMGGEPARLGGRTRYHLPGTDWYATVGARTTFIYRRAGREVVEGQSFRTRDLHLITGRLEALAVDHAGAQTDRTDAR